MVPLLSSFWLLNIRDGWQKVVGASWTNMLRGRKRVGNMSNWCFPIEKSEGILYASFNLDANLVFVE